MQSGIKSIRNTYHHKILIHLMYFVVRQKLKLLSEKGLSVDNTNFWKIRSLFSLQIADG